MVNSPLIRPYFLGGGGGGIGGVPLDSHEHGFFNMLLLVIVMAPKQGDRHDSLKRGTKYI